MWVSCGTVITRSAWQAGRQGGMSRLPWASPPGLEVTWSSVEKPLGQKCLLGSPREGLAVGPRTLKGWACLQGSGGMHPAADTPDDHCGTDSQRAHPEMQPHTPGAPTEGERRQNTPHGPCKIQHR